VLTHPRTVPIPAFDAGADADAGAADDDAGTGIELTILMPCLNEAETLAVCIDKAQGYLARSGVVGEVLIADNGSTDGSQQIARDHGARVVDIGERGYGSALIGGIRAARGRSVIMGDSDDSYDFSDLMPFVARLREGYDLVMGNRFMGGIKPGAMPPLHRYLGNPVLTMVGRVFFRSPCGDFHCGLRGFNRDAMLALGLQAPGMEFASEMVVKATVHRLRITEVPTTLSPDGRSRPPHLRSWRDGWRHLRFLLIFSPRWLFLYPGLAFALTGVLAMAALVAGPRYIGRVGFDIHTMLYAGMSVILGVQAVLFWIFAKIYGVREGIVQPDPAFSALLEQTTLERGLIAGTVMLVAGILLGIYAVSEWQTGSFGPLNPAQTMRLVIPSAVLVLTAMQIIYGAFFIAVLGIRGSHREPETGTARGAG
jgi:glycosyltransferase involved in cell wall biosynthesis